MNFLRIYDYNVICVPNLNDTASMLVEVFTLIK